MNAANKLLDKFAEACGASKDSEIAARLRVSKQAVSGWRNAKAHPNAEAIEMMCKAAGEKPEHWLPLIESERSRTPGDRKAWLRLAQLAAGLAGVYLLSRLGVQTHDAFLASGLYIMRNLGIVVLLALAACAARESKEKQNHARILER